MKTGKEHLRYVTCLWSGLDIGPDGFSGKDKHFGSEKQAMMAIMAFPLKPSIIVQSGRGMHLYWLLRHAVQVADPDDFEKLLNRISNYFQCQAPSGLDAVLRLPETWNSKDSAQTVNCHLERLEPSLRYDLDEFEDLDLRIIIPSKRAPKMPQVKLPTPVRISVVDPHSASAQAALHARSGSQLTATEPDDDATAEVEEISAEEATVTLDDQSMERLADMLMERFSDMVMDRLADRVARKVLQALVNPGGNT
jgi:hypothetical protein